jgi:protein subunit release factor B
MVISKHKQEELKQRMQSLGIKEGDIEEKFILGSGKGGQKINKTASCVYIKHLPSGIEVKCQKDRSRELNRFLARRALCECIEEQDSKVKSERRHLAEKIRRQKRRRSRRHQEKVLEEKRQQSEKKNLRQTPEE